MTPKDIVRPRIPRLLEESLRETNIVELGGAFADLGHTTTVLLGDSYLNGRAVTLTTKLEVASVNTIMRFPFHPALLPMTPGLMRHPALREADIIQTGEFHQPSTFFASMVADEVGVPLVVWQETFRPMRSPGSWYQRAYEVVLGRYLRTNVKLYVPRTTRASSYLRGLRVAENNITKWIPTGIDLGRFEPRDSNYSPEDFGWIGDVKILLLVARLHRDKGVDIALQVLKRLLQKDSSVRLIVRGSGPDLKRLIHLANDLDIADKTCFLDRVSREQMLNLYSAAHVALCTSRNDLLPFALMEASACGLPCVTTDVGAVRDIVVNGVTGLVVEDGTVDKLAEAILSLLGEENLRVSFGREARRRMEAYFDLTSVARGLLEVYRDACS